jgi:hypothetical protein|nr:MAG TPA: hypothetical protein [Caudoviricetes sp.]
MNFKQVIRIACLGRISKGAISLLLHKFGDLFNGFEYEINKWVERQMYEMSITPQVCYLEKALNDYYHLTGARRIYITEPLAVEGKFFFRETDQKDFHFIDSTFFIDDTHYNGYDTDFIVVIPVIQGIPVVQKSNTIFALVEKYKMVSKLFSVKYSNEL